MIDMIRRRLATLRRRASLKNHNFTIISNTCIGCVISNSLGEAFRSPTVNLILFEEDFLTFCENLAAYSKCEMVPPSPAQQEEFRQLGYPVGILCGSALGLPDLTVRFVHYRSFEEARAAWHRRFARVNYDNLFVLMDRGIDASDEILDRFHALPYPRKVFFTHKEDPARWPCTFRFSCYTPDKYKNGALYNFVRRGLLQYRVLDEFDYVHWLNTGVIHRNPLFSDRS